MNAYETWSIDEDLVDSSSESDALSDDTADDQDDGSLQVSKNIRESVHHDCNRLCFDKTLKILFLQDVNDDEMELFADVINNNSSVLTVVLKAHRMTTRGQRFFADMLRTNSNFNSVEIENGTIFGDFAKAVVEAVQANTAITRLAVSEPARSTAEGIETLVSAPLSCLLLQHLSLKSIRMNYDETVGLAAALRATTELESLNLTRIQGLFNNATNTQVFANALAENRSLQDLNLNGNKIRHGALQAIAWAIAARSKPLRTLQIYGVGSFDVNDTSAIAGALENNGLGVHLFLGSNRLGNTEIIPLARVLERPSTTLKTLDLRENGIGLGGATAIARLLANTSSLEILDLSHNWIENEGASEIARAIEENTSLRNLNLDYNSVGDRGAFAFAEAITRSKGGALEVLGLGDNFIHHEGARALIKALETTKPMDCVRLVGLQGDHESVVDALIESIPRKIFVRTLSLGYRNWRSCSPQTFSKLTKAMEHNCVVESFGYQLCAFRSYTQISYYMKKVHHEIVKDRVKPTAARLPLALWPFILERVNASSTSNVDVLFQYLCKEPNLFVSRR